MSFERAAALVFHLLGICAALVYLSERFQMTLLADWDEGFWSTGMWDGGAASATTRTYVVPAESRTLTVSAEDRTFVVAAEARTLEVA